MEKFYRKKFSKLPPELGDYQLIVYVNPTGLFVTGESIVEASIKEWKTIFDTLDGMDHHCSRAFGRFIYLLFKSSLTIFANFFVIL